MTFNDELFVRSRLGMTPTPRAQLIYPQIREARALVRGALAKEQYFEPSRDQRCCRLLGDNYFEALALGPLMALLQLVGSELNVETLAFAGQEQD
ncbi:hypothetical protein [Zhongshania sp.]|uniref:hypothetical protein n=1 Tax=Zhongshania sp. TaxID=1971902 RepID=UPI00356AA90F